MTVVKALSMAILLGSLFGAGFYATRQVGPSLATTVVRIHYCYYVGFSLFSIRYFYAKHMIFCSKHRFSHYSAFKSPIEK